MTSPCKKKTIVKCIYHVEIPTYHSILVPSPKNGTISTYRLVTPLTFSNANVVNPSSGLLFSLLERESRKHRSSHFIQCLWITLKFEAIVQKSNIWECPITCSALAASCNKTVATWQLTDKRAHGIIVQKQTWRSSEPKVEWIAKLAKIFSLTNKACSSISSATM